MSCLIQTVVIELQAGRRIGQLVFAFVDNATDNPYNGKYQGQTKATGLKVYMDSESEYGWNE